MKLVQVLERETSDSKEASSIVDMYSWMGRASLDVIGAAGFGWDFSALDREVPHF
jgi:hypothetical protein